MLRIPHASQAVHQLQPSRWRSWAQFCSRRDRNPQALFVLGVLMAAEEGGGELAPTPAAPSVQSAPPQRAQDLSYPLVVLGVSRKLKVVGNGASVLGRWRPSLHPGKWYWLVLVAFPTSRDGQSGLKAKGEKQSSEAAEIYCSRKLKMYASAFGVTVALPLPVCVGIRAMDSSLLCSTEV